MRVSVNYLVTAMSHPIFGRPLIKALAYGSSIPEIDVMDIEPYPIVRLMDAEESATAELAQRGREGKCESRRAGARDHGRRREDHRQIHRRMMLVVNQSGNAVF